MTQSETPSTIESPSSEVNNTIVSRPTPLALEIHSLTKTYQNGFTALNGISFDVKQGEFFALLGPNGAGKSTTIGIISTLLKKSSGQVLINGYDIDQSPDLAKLTLGIVPQEFNFNIFETPYNILINQAGFFGISKSTAHPRALELLKQLDILDKKNVQSGKLSGGQKRRLMIARALIHSPKILILDEPTAGVDIQLRREMYTFLEDLNRNGLTIILTTHYLEEAERLCEQIAIINKGTIIINKPKKEVLSILKTEFLTLEIDPTSTKTVITPDDISPIAPLVKLTPTTIQIELSETASISEVLTQLSSIGIVIKRVLTQSNRLEEIFIKLTTMEKS